MIYLTEKIHEVSSVQARVIVLLAMSSKLTNELILRCLLKEIHKTRLCIDNLTKML